ncbi:MAG: GNAT family N-acetyltransferase [Clostridia bacterium]|nr:GNAT family N-acetyltransferase [Clostridia bacterium]
MIETTRLRIYPASKEQMEIFIAAQSDEILIAAYMEMLGGCLSHPDQWEWYAIWMIELKDGTHVGDLCFKGVDESGSTEIGYGIDENYQGHGYAAEAVSALVDWALKQTGVSCVTAETEESNFASQRVLKKCGFIPTGETGEEGPLFARRITIRPEEHRDYHDIVSLVLRSFKEGTDYSDGTDIVALIEEIRDSEYYIPELSFVAELDGEIVGHFLFSRFPLSKTPKGGHGGPHDTDIVMLAPVSVHADHLRQGIGSVMLRLGIQKVKEMGFQGIIVEGNYRFYNTIGFRTSSEYGIFPVSGYPMTEPRCQMYMETRSGSLKGHGGFVVYDMYYNA